LSITNDVFVECQLRYFFKKCIKNRNILLAASYRYLLMSSDLLFEFSRQWCCAVSSIPWTQLEECRL